MSPFSLKTAGVLGGMGPDATVDFLARVIAHTPATRDQDHVPMLVDHNPAVPSRQAASVGDAPDPSDVIADMGLRLECAGAEFLVMPCNLAHVFTDKLRASVNIPLVSIVDATVGEIDSTMDCIGVMAIDGCLNAGLFQHAIERAGKQWLLPGESELADLKKLVNRVKAGERGKAVVNGMRTIALALVERGADVVVAACTEIPLVLSDEGLGVPLLSSTDALARKTVALSLGQESMPPA